jgi:hypothetical protein
MSQQLDQLLFPIGHIRIDVHPEDSLQPVILTGTRSRDLNACMAKSRSGTEIPYRRSVR